MIALDRFGYSRSTVDDLYAELTLAMRLVMDLHGYIASEIPATEFQSETAKGYYDEQRRTLRAKLREQMGVYYMTRHTRESREPWPMGPKS